MMIINRVVFFNRNVTKWDMQLEEGDLRLWQDSE